MLELLEAAVLGIVQGLTEFLPVSSSGHLLLGHLSPLGWEHITLTGTYRWDLTATSSLEDLPKVLRR